MTTLAERLGHGADTRVLIVNCDDLGASHAANIGVYESLRDGAATSASLMVPAPWAREAAARYGAAIVDFSETTIFEDPATLSEDGNHPNAAGYDVIAEIWYRAISSAVAP